MKQADTKKPFPTTDAEWEAAIAAAPKGRTPPTPREEEMWRNAVLVNGGGYAAVRAAVAAKRKPGQRGPQVAPTKQLVSVRYSPEVLSYFRAGGSGWQTRMDEALKDWIAARTARP